MRHKPVTLEFKVETKGMWKFYAAKYAQGLALGLGFVTALGLWGWLT